MSRLLAHAPALLLLASLFAAANSHAAPPPPVEAYAVLPEATLVRLSPDGRHLAYASDYKGHQAVVITDLKGDAKPKVFSIAPFELDNLQWKDSDQLVASLRSFFKERGNRWASTRLVVIKRDGSAVRDLVEADRYGDLPQIQSRLVDLLPGDPKHLLLALPHFERPTGAVSTQSVAYGGYLRENDLKYLEVVEVDVDNGRTRVVQNQRVGIVGWGSDEAGKLRLGYTLNGKVQGVDYRDDASAAWRTLSSSPTDQSAPFEPLAFSPTDPDILYVSSDLQGGDKGRHKGIFAYSLKQDRFLRPVAYRQGEDVNPILDGKRLVGYSFGTEAPTYIDPDWRKDFQTIQAALPQANPRLVDRSRDGRSVLFRTRQGNNPVTYWLLDRSSGETEAKELISLYADVPTESIAPTRLVHYQARDGLDIPALLTLPLGHGSGKDARPLPFVVLPHGGPADHDRSGFDPWVQLLASRGYGVLQPQFRGSTGFGLAHILAARGQWGLAMQDDLTDGTLWLRQQKLADPARICIVGASYGGYAAVQGLVKEPGLYKCAVAFAPVTDLVNMSDDSADYLFGEYTRDYSGRNEAQLALTSPARHADKVQAPLLLIHGRKDDVVPVRHTENLAAAWGKAGKQVEVIYLDEGDHHLSRAADRLTTFKALERFLAVQLGTPEQEARAGR